MVNMILYSNKMMQEDISDHEEKGGNTNGVRIRKFLM